MKKLYIQTEAPVKDKTIVAKDKSTSIILGFICPKKEEVKPLHEAFNAVLVDGTDAAIQSFLTAQIRYIKNASLQVYDENDEFVETVVVEDSRKVAKNDYWETPADCLSVLISNFFSSISWGNQIFEGYNEFLTETILGVSASVEELEVKN